LIPVTCNMEVLKICFHEAYNKVSDDDDDTIAELEAENESMEVELSDARDKYNNSIRRKLDLKKENERPRQKVAERGERMEDMLRWIPQGIVRETFHEQNPDWFDGKGKAK